MCYQGLDVCALTHGRAPGEFSSLVSPASRCGKRPTIACSDAKPGLLHAAIEDPNTGTVLWESCAIIRYLIDQYDTSHILSYTNPPEKALLDQWLFFQASGQGPYYGQAAWFNIFHPEKLPSAQARYINEAKRVIGVLDTALGQSKSGWLVGDKCTYVDLAFFMWDEQIPQIMGAASSPEWDEKNYPKWATWHKRMAEREAVKKVVDEKAKMLAGAQH